MFDKIKPIAAKDLLLAYTDFNNNFHMHTGARDYQLSAVMIQERKPILFYSRNITGTQTRYTVTEEELISIV